MEILSILIHERGVISSCPFGSHYIDTTNVATPLLFVDLVVQLPLLVLNYISGYCRLLLTLLMIKEFFKSLSGKSYRFLLFFFQKYTVTLTGAQDETQAN